MKTTPKPSATKKSSGELAGPLEFFPWLPCGGGLVGLGAAMAEDMVAGRVSTGPYVEEGASVDARRSRSTTRKPCYVSSQMRTVTRIPVQDETDKGRRECCRRQWLFKRPAALSGAIYSPWQWRIPRGGLCNAPGSAMVAARLRAWRGERARDSAYQRVRLCSEWDVEDWAGDG